MNWLDEEQLRAWRAFAALLVVLPATLDAEMHRRAGITQFEYGVLAALSDAPGTPCGSAPWPASPRARCPGCPT